MTSDVDTAGFPIIKLRLPEYAALTHRAATAEGAKAENTEAKEDHKRELPLIVLELGRGACWALALLCFATAVFLSTLHWTHKWTAPIGVISLCSLGVISFIVSAHAIRASIHHRQILALAAEIRAEIRADIRDHAPADAIELARIATMVQRVWSAVVKQDEQLAELIPLAVSQAARAAYAQAVQDLRAEFAAEREAAARDQEETLKRVFAQGYVAGVRERVKGDGGKVVQLPVAEA